MDVDVFYKLNEQAKKHLKRSNELNELAQIELDKAKECLKKMKV